MRGAGVVPRLLFSCGIIYFLNVDPAIAQAPASLPPPWNAQDIGAPTTSGGATFDQEQFTITAGGQDIWGPSDQFHFVYQQVTGDVDVTARVESITMTDAWAKAGVMIRSSLDAGAAHGFALVSAAQGVAFQRRSQDGGLTTHTSGPTAGPPRWVRLVRVGTRITASTSVDGQAWSTIASSTIALGSTAYVGLAATSHNVTAATTAVLSQASVVRLALPDPQQSTDIGDPAVKGSASYRDGTYTIRTGGADIWGTADQFHYVYQQVSGDVELVARVKSITYASSWAKTGVMIRETLSPGSKHGFATLSAGRGYAFQRRVETDGFSDHTAGSAGAAPGWVRLVRTGPQLEAFQSADGTNWVSIGSEAIPMADTVYVGIATTSHRTDRATQAVVDNLKVITPGSTANGPPVVALTSPPDGSTFTAGNDITIGAAASDSDGTIDRVEFFAGTTLIGSDATQPYAVDWQGVAAGSYSITAVAFDNDGGKTTSAPAAVTVGAPSNAPPAVTLTGPEEGASFTAPATIGLTATASDPENSLARVEFYSGTTLPRIRYDCSVPIHVVVCRRG